MKYLVDQNLPTSIADRLTDVGRDAQHTEPAGMARTYDADVFDWCRANDAILLTADKKLTKYLADQRITSPTVVIFRDYYEDTVTLGNDLLANLDTIEATVTNQGHAVFSMGPNRPMRVQLLPIG